MDAKIHLNELSFGYHHSVVLLTACRIGLFEAMQKQLCSAASLAETLGVEAQGLERVMLALAADGVLRQEESSAGVPQFRLDPQYAPYLLENSPETQIHILNHQYNCLQRWVGLEARLKTHKVVACAPAAVTDAEWSLRNFILGMADISRQSSEEVAGKLDLSTFHHLADIGGGPATASIVFARHFPQLRCTVLDLEDTLEIAREEIDKAGMARRVGMKTVDYMRDEFGSGYDVAYISNIIHSLGPDGTRMIFDKTYRALEPGGMIVVKDFYLEPSRTAPAQAAFFSINMLVATGQGRSYTWDETEDLLKAAGFKDFSRMPVAVASGLIMARK